MHIRLEPLPVGDLGLAHVGVVPGVREWMAVAAVCGCAAAALTVWVRVKLVKP